MLEYFSEKINVDLNGQNWKKNKNPDRQNVLQITKMKYKTKLAIKKSDKTPINGNHYRFSF